MAGLGPFRLKSYVPGDRLVLERNPHYWKVDRAGRPLPYLDEIVFLLVPSEDAQVIRFKAGETDLISRLSAANFTVLARDQVAGRYRLEDLGPGLEYSFLFFNLNTLDAGKLAAVSRKQSWFSRTEFRQAVSAALDRQGMARLVYQGRGTPLATHVTPGNKLWMNGTLPPPARSLSGARDRLGRAGFSWKDGTLQDEAGEAVEFTIITNASNASRVQMASIIQDDLRELGLRVQVVPLENRALDLWSIMAFVAPGYLGNRSDFSARYDRADAPPHLRDPRMPIVRLANAYRRSSHHNIPAASTKNIIVGKTALGSGGQSYSTPR